MKTASLPVREALETSRADEKQGRDSGEDMCVDVNASDSDELEGLYRPDVADRGGPGATEAGSEVGERLKAGWDYPMIQDELGFGPVNDDGIPESVRSLL